MEFKELLGNALLPVDLLSFINHWLISDLTFSVISAIKSKRLKAGIRYTP
jgi:hypothetical protein